ncbi:MAG TPA: hypothetical protein VM238_19620 [Phycisphaerae bacterium]|nr:hypothetical protein [Phycisphaerae bacterium]
MRHVLTVIALLTFCHAAFAQIDLYVTDTMATQDKSIKPLGGRPTAVATMFAAPGEVEPASFALQPKERLASVMITAGDLKGPGGTIPAANVRVRSVEGFHGEGRDILMDLGRAWDMAAWSKELFWVTVKVPADSGPGTYKGVCTVTSDSKPVARLAIELEVLPIALEEPPYALGFNYSNPKDPAVLAAHLKDMRDHGMTVVGPLYNFHLPVTDDDTSELGAFLEAYLAAGFKQPVYFATPMNLTISGLTGYGSIDSKRFQQKYFEVMHTLHAEALKHPVPVIFSIGDEFTNKGVKGVEFAGRLARLTWEEMPEMITTSDMNGYMEVMAMAPYLNVAAINNGWDGIDHHNKGRRLINREFLTELTAKTGAIPWFVNAGSGRFPFGLFFWKMTRYGVIGKVEWYYNLENGKGSLVRTEGKSISPTLDYERSREGIDDLKYILALEKRIAQAKKAGKAAAQVRAAEALLKQIADSIIDNWTAYTQGGETFPADGFDAIDPAKADQLGAFNTLRRAVADATIAIQEAM